MEEELWALDGAEGSSCVILQCGGGGKPRPRPLAQVWPFGNYVRSLFRDPCMGEGSAVGLGPSLGPSPIFPPQPLFPGTQPTWMSSGARWLWLSGGGSSFWAEGRAVLGEQKRLSHGGFCSRQAICQLRVPEPHSQGGPQGSAPRQPPEWPELGVWSPSTAA